jgi:hypothetical protein
MQSVGYWIRTTFPDIDHSIGSALWTVFINRDVYTPEGELIRGTFRWWGGIIADVVGAGEDYLDYYCDYAPDYLCDEVTDALLKAGWRLEYEAEICKACGKPIERGEMVAHDFKTGINIHALCIIPIKKAEYVASLDSLKK